MVIAIVGLLIGGLLAPLANQVSLRRVNETQTQLGEIKDALYGFALANGRLPCPDSAGNDGLEDLTGPVTTRVCSAAEGNLPWVELGISQFDSWNRRFLYRVDPGFADMTPDGDGTGCGTATVGISFELCSLGNITIRDGEATYVGPPPSQPVANSIPAVVISAGPAALHDGDGDSSLNEDENTDNDAVFVARDFSEEDDFEIDDLVIWISPNVLKAKLVSASRLP